MHLILLRTLLPRLAANRAVILVIRHIGVALLAGVGARIGGDIYDAVKKRADKSPPKPPEASAVAAQEEAPSS